jgi:hypothetical protein
MKVFLTVFLVLILGLSLSLTLDENAMKLQDEAFDRAMIAFGLAKGLNAVISLIQGTELSVAPVGIGLTFSVGEVLDPFNDMVERFSWVMLFASVSLGIQKLLLVLSSKIFLQVALVASASFAIIFFFTVKLQSSKLLSISMRIFMFLLVLRFAAIFFVYASDYFYNAVLVTEYKTSASVIESTKAKLEDIQNQNTNIVKSQKESGFFSGVSSQYNDFVENLNISKQLESLQTNIEDASRNIINLITIFVVQSVVMPLLFLWFFISSIKWIFRTDLDNEKLFFLLNKTKISV